MKRLIFLVACALGAPVKAQQGDPMALQRCIWACLANSPGAASAAYHQCVNARCAGPQVAAPSGSAPSWQAGLASDGRSWTAGVADQGNDGRGIYYVCNRARESYLMLHGFHGRAGLYQLGIGGRLHPVLFDRRRGTLSVDLPANASLLGSLAAGNTISITDPDGRYQAALSLAGSRAAIGRALAECGY